MINVKLDENYPKQFFTTMAGLGIKAGEVKEAEPENVEILGAIESKIWKVVDEKE